MKSGINRGIIVNAQEYSTWKKFKPSNIGRGIGEWVSSDYKNVMESLRSADQNLRDLTLNKSNNPYDISLKDAVARIDYSLKKNLFIDAYYYAYVAGQVVKFGITESKELVNEIRNIKSEELTKTDIGLEDFEDLTKADTALKSEAQLKSMFKYLFGDPMEKAYKKQIMEVKTPLMTLNRKTQTYFANIIKLFNELGSARASGDVYQWIKIYDKIDYVTKSFEKEVSKYYPAIKKLTDLAGHANKVSEISTPEVAKSLNIVEKVDSELPKEEQTLVSKPEPQVENKTNETVVDVPVNSSDVNEPENVPTSGISEPVTPPEDLPVEKGEETVIPPVTEPVVNEKQKQPVKKELDLIKTFESAAKFNEGVKENLTNALDIIFSDWSTYTSGRDRKDIVYKGKLIGFTSGKRLYIEGVKEFNGKYIALPFSKIPQLAAKFGIDPTEYLSIDDLEEIKNDTETEVEQSEQAKSSEPSVSTETLEPEDIDEPQDPTEDSLTDEEFDDMHQGYQTVEDFDLEEAQSQIDQSLTKADPDELEMLTNMSEFITANKESIKAEIEKGPLELKNDKDEVVAIISKDKIEFPTMVRSNGEPVVISKNEPALIQQLEGSTESLEESSEKDLTIDTEGTVVDESEPSVEGTLYSINKDAWEELESLDFSVQSARQLIGQKNAEQLKSKYTKDIDEASYIIIVFDPDKLKQISIDDAKKSLSKFSNKQFDLVGIGDLDGLKEVLNNALKIGGKFAMAIEPDQDLFSDTNSSNLITNNDEEEPTVESDEISEPSSEETVKLEDLDAFKEQSKSEIPVEDNIEKQKRIINEISNQQESNVTSSYLTVEPDVFYNSANVNVIPVNSNTLKSFGFNLSDSGDADFANELISNYDINSNNKGQIDDGIELEKAIIIYNSSLIDKKNIMPAKNAIINFLDLPDIDSADIYFVKAGDNKAMRRALIACKDSDFMIFEWTSGELFYENETQKQPVTASTEKTLKALNKVFYNKLEKVASTKNKYAIASMLLDHSERIEKYDAGMSSKLLEQARKLINES